MANSAYFIYFRPLLTFWICECLKKQNNFHFLSNHLLLLFFFGWKTAKKLLLCYLAVVIRFFSPVIARWQIESPKNQNLQRENQSQLVCLYADT